MFRLRSAILALLFIPPVAGAAIGDRFPSERRVVEDPRTGVPLTFLTSKPAGDRKIYPTHPQWTSDGEWVIFRSDRVPGQAMAVHERTGEMVQVTESGYRGALCVAQRSMRLFHLRAAANAGAGDGRRRRVDLEVVAIDLGRLFRDSAAGEVGPALEYETVFGTIPAAMAGGGELALDAGEQQVYFRISGDAAEGHLKPGTEIKEDFGPRGMGAGPSGIGCMELASGEVSVVAAVPFQVGHIQASPWVEGQIVFCWETGGKAPQRTWTVRSDGGGLQPLFPETEHDWVTHEAITGPDEVALAILGHRKLGANDAWGPAGSRLRPTGLAIVNLSSGELRLEGQTHGGSGLWHVHASADGRWAIGDDFARNLWLIDRRTGEMRLLTAGHKASAEDHPHPTFHPDGTRIQFQSAMLSDDDRALDIVVVPVPKDWLNRDYDDSIQPSP